MSNQISNTDDVIDSRDVIRRIEELEEELTALQGVYDDTDSREAQTDVETWLNDNNEELQTLKALAEECKGYGDWEHGETLIHRDYFVKYIEELIDDCYRLPKQDGWPYYHLIMDYEAAAREAEQGYNCVEFDGQEYLIRA